MPDTEPDGAPLDAVADARNIVSDACACDYEGCRVFLAERVKQLAELLGFTFPADPVTITTADQIRALPVGAVLLDNGENAWQVRSSVVDPSSARYLGSVDLRINLYWLATDQDAASDAISAYGPFRVLHTPGGHDAR